MNSGYIKEKEKYINLSWQEALIPCLLASFVFSLYHFLLCWRMYDNPIPHKLHFLAINIDNGFFKFVYMHVCLYITNLKW